MTEEISTSAQTVGTTRMPERLPKDLVFLQMTNLLGNLSTCDRASIGCIITRDGRAVSWGYNGAPPGMTHCSENGHGYYDEVRDHQMSFWQGDPPTTDYMRMANDMAKVHGCRNTTHAEANALAFAARQGISTENGTCYLSVSPCVKCAQLLIAAGIVRVVCSVPYRRTDGVDLLESAGVEVVIVG